MIIIIRIIQSKRKEMIYLMMNGTINNYFSQNMKYNKIIEIYFTLRT